MEVTFLGTGTSQGIPVIGSKHPVCLSNDARDKRLRTSALVQWDAFSFVIDCGPDFRQQMLRCGCENIDGILYTHEHSDHVVGLDDIRPFYFKQGDISIYAHKRVLKALKKRFDYVFKTHNRYSGAPSVNIFRLKNKPFSLGGKTIIPIKGLHGKLKVFGFRFDAFCYLTDIKSMSAEEMDKIRNVDVLVVNALRIEPHYSHFNLEEALAFIAQIKPKRAYLTHISHLLGFHETVEAQLPEHVYLAYDNLKITI